MLEEKKLESEEGTLKCKVKGSETKEKAKG